MTRALDVARRFLGKLETDGPNDGPEIRAMLAEFGIHKPASWCAIDVAHSLCEAYGLQGRAGLRAALGFASPFYVDSTRDWLAQARRLDMVTDTPRAGDLAVFLDGKREACHIGFVEAPPRILGAQAVFTTIEGNTSSGEAGSQTNGDGRYRRARKWEPWRFAFIALPDALRG